MQAVVDLYQGISRRAEFAGASGRELAVFGADGCGPDAHGGSHGDGAAAGAGNGQEEISVSGDAAGAGIPAEREGRT